MVNTLTDAYVAALTAAAKEEPTPYVEVSDEVIDALGAAPPKPKQQNTSVAYAGTERTQVERQQRKCLSPSLTGSSFSILPQW